MKKTSRNPLGSLTITFLALFLSGITPISAYASTKRVATWHEISFLGKLADCPGNGTGSGFGVNDEVRSEKYSLVTSLDQTRFDSFSLKTLYIGFGAYPDWELPFEPGVEFKVGASSNNKIKDGSMTPTWSTKVSVTILKNNESGISVRFFGEQSHLSEGIDVFQTGIQVILGAK